MAYTAVKLRQGEWTLVTTESNMLQVRSVNNARIWIHEGNAKPVLTPSINSPEAFWLLSSAGAVLGRHGSYLGDVTVTRPSTGDFLISAGTKIWGDELTIIATPTGTTAKEITAGTGGLGRAYVNTYDAAGNALSDAFYVALYW